MMLGAGLAQCYLPHPEFLHRIAFAFQKLHEVASGVGQKPGDPERAVAASCGLLSVLT